MQKHGDTLRELILGAASRPSGEWNGLGGGGEVLEELENGAGVPCAVVFLGNGPLESLQDDLESQVNWWPVALGEPRLRWEELRYPPFPGERERRTDVGAFLWSLQLVGFRAWSPGPEGTWIALGVIEPSPDATCYLVALVCRPGR